MTLVEMMVWKRAQRCESNGCVEVAQVGETFFVRQSDDPATSIMFTRLEWDVFLAGVRGGDFD